MNVNKIILTDEAHRAIRTAAGRYVSVEAGERQPDGTWAVEVDDEVLAAIKRVQTADESMSDVLVRLVATRWGAN